MHTRLEQCVRRSRQPAAHANAPSPGRTCPLPACDAHGGTHGTALAAGNETAWQVSYGSQAAPAGSYAVRCLPCCMCSSAWQSTALPFRSRQLHLQSASCTQPCERVNVAGNVQAGQLDRHPGRRPVWCRRLCRLWTQPSRTWTATAWCPPAAPLLVRAIPSFCAVQGLGHRARVWARPRPACQDPAPLLSVVRQGRKQRQVTLPCRWAEGHGARGGGGHAQDAHRDDRGLGAGAALPAAASGAAGARPCRCCGVRAASSATAAGAASSQGAGVHTAAVQLYRDQHVRAGDRACGTVRPGSIPMLA